jgi:hypothetical protein
MPQRDRGEFFYTKELREHVDIPKSKLLMLGKAGLLFAQVQARRYENYTLFRYHLPYIRALVDVLNFGAHEKELYVQCTEYAGAHTELMSVAISRYYDRIFSATAVDQLRPDGKPYLYREQARDVMNMSAAKINRYSDPNYEAPGGRPTWNPENLAGIFEWVVPGPPETVAIIRDNLGDLATQYAVINGKLYPGN